MYFPDSKSNRNASVGCLFYSCIFFNWPLLLFLYIWISVCYFFLFRDYIFWFVVLSRALVLLFFLLIPCFFFNIWWMEGNSTTSIYSKLFLIEAELSTHTIAPNVVSVRNETRTITTINYNVIGKLKQFSLFSVDSVHSFFFFSAIYIRTYIFINILCFSLWLLLSFAIYSQTIQNNQQKKTKRNKRTIYKTRSVIMLSIIRILHLKKKL